MGCSTSTTISWSAVVLAAPGNKRTYPNCEMFFRCSLNWLIAAIPCSIHLSHPSSSNLLSGNLRRHPPAWPFHTSTIECASSSNSLLVPAVCCCPAALQHNEHLSARPWALQDLGANSRHRAGVALARHPQHRRPHEQRRWRHCPNPIPKRPLGTNDPRPGRRAISGRSVHRLRLAGGSTLEQEGRIRDGRAFNSLAQVKNAEGLVQRPGGADELSDALCSPLPSTTRVGPPDTAH